MMSQNAQKPRGTIPEKVNLYLGSLSVSDVYFISVIWDRCLVLGPAIHNDAWPGAMPIYHREYSVSRSTAAGI
jgi:hypothetical protein